MVNATHQVHQCNSHPSTNRQLASKWDIDQTALELAFILQAETTSGGTAQLWYVPDDRKCDAVAWQRALVRAPLRTPKPRRLQRVPTASEAAFAELANAWQRETAAMSSVTMIAAHPAYQRIIGMGPSVLPLIFRELSRQPNHWFWALAAITGGDPVPAEEAGDVQKMTERWLAFGKERGYL